jgi:hypothetical protein
MGIPLGKRIPPGKSSSLPEAVKVKVYVTFWLRSLRRSRRALPQKHSRTPNNQPCAEPPVMGADHSRAAGDEPSPPLSGRRDVTARTHRRQQGTLQPGSFGAGLFPVYPHYW